MVRLNSSTGELRDFSESATTTDRAVAIPRSMAEWATATASAHRADELRAIRRYVWISDEGADAFGNRVLSWSMSSPNHPGATGAELTRPSPPADWTEQPPLPEQATNG